MGDGIISRRGLGNSSDLSNYYNKTETDNLLSGKVDKVTGKGLSTEDYTTAEKTKLSNIEAEANKTVVVQTTGSSTSSVISQNAVTNLLSRKMDNISYSTGDWNGLSNYVLEFGWSKHNNSTSSGYEYGNRGGTYSRRTGYYVRIGDLCYVNFSMKMIFGGQLGGNYNVAMGYFPFPAYSSYIQTLSLGVFAKLNSNGDQIWTPTAGLALRLIPGERFAVVTQENGYIDIPWDQDDTSSTFYMEGSGVYRVSNFAAGEEPSFDNTGSSAPPVGGQT